MRHVLNVKVLREIKNNFKTYLSVILIAALAVTLFTGIFANYKNFNDRLEHIYQEANMCDGIIMLKNYDGTIEEDLKNENIYFEKRIYYPTKYENNNIYLVTFDDHSKLNQPYSNSVGTIDSSMVFVDANFLNRNHLSIGDEIHCEFSLLAEKLNIDLKINGTMTHPESLENSTYNPAFIYVGYQALRDAISKSAYLNPFVVDELLKFYTNQFLIKGDIKILFKIKENHSQKDTFIYALKRSDLPSNMTVDADVNQAKQLIYIFPVIFYLVAVLIILTSISQLIHKESKNIGILKALGFSKKEILFHYMKIFIVLGLIGSFIGMILGPIIVPNVMGHKYDILYQLPEIKLPFLRIEYGISILILLCIIVFTSLFACYGAMNQVPASSLRGENAVKMKVTFLSKYKVFSKIPLSFLMAFRNMKRKISRTLMVILGVLGCSALLVCGFGIEDTINYGLDLELDDLIPYDVTVSYATYHTKEESIKQIKGVSGVDEYAKYSISVEKDSLISSYLFLLPDKAQIFHPAYTTQSCLLSTKVAEEIGAKIGDAIHFIYNGKRYEFIVTDIIDFCLSQGVFLSKEAIKTIEFAPTGAWIKTTQKELNAEVASSIEAISGISTATTIEDMRFHANETISSIKVMTWTVKIFAILLAVVVLYNLALLNFKERFKDIATLKVLGFSRLEVAASFIIEILFLTFVGAIIGLFLGYPLLVAVLSINENPLLSYIYHINWSSYIITVLITCGSSLLINLIFAYLTHKVEMVESLKSVE
ncbi:MAG: ABC transporter permease [Anaeroplasmataceae bacterium]|nr:ABC transporter permease [Anaeroplasmataceae bacterium]